MKVRARVAWNLRALRTARRVTQENLAVDANIDRTTVSGLEQGSYNASLDLLERLAEALDVDVAELLAVPPHGAEDPAPMRPGRKPKAGDRG